MAVPGVGVVKKGGKFGKTLFWLFVGVAAIFAEGWGLLLLIPAAVAYVLKRWRYGSTHKGTWYRNDPALGRVRCNGDLPNYPRAKFWLDMTMGGCGALIIFIAAYNIVGGGRKLVRTGLPSPESVARSISGARAGASYGQPPSGPLTRRIQVSRLTEVDLKAIGPGGFTPEIDGDPGVQVRPKGGTWVPAHGKGDLSLKNSNWIVEFRGNGTATIKFFPPGQ